MRDTASRWARRGAALAAVASGLLALSCGQILGSADLEIGECVDGARRCTGNTLERCAQGRWSLDKACDNKTCEPDAGSCGGECGPQSRRCLGDTPQTCDPEGKWQNAPLCSDGQHCSGGSCLVDCGPNDVRCVGNTPQHCIDHGQWTDQDLGACQSSTCLSGACVGECALGDALCQGATPRACDVHGIWKDQPACSSLCVSGSCPGPSCAMLKETCGPQNNESCCLSPVVWGGTYNRSNDAQSPATVSDFRLDRFEVTVGRFRAFVNAYPGSRPKIGVGAHPLIPKSGWSSSWNSHLPKDQTVLTAELKCGGGSWTDQPGGNEKLPINCIDWYRAFAFCAWDGGRLPTEAEWNYAAAGGGEQRVYPWSNPPSSQTIEPTYAVYYRQGPSPVGSTSPRGDGKWRQADLAGNAEEWILDWYGSPYESKCIDCAALSVPNGESLRVLRSGNWWIEAFEEASLFTSSRRYFDPNLANEGLLKVVGIRCARQP